MNFIRKIGENSKIAFNTLKNVNHERIEKVLNDYNKLLSSNISQILSKNKIDCKSSKRKKLIDRLILNKQRIDGIRNSINEIRKFKNPVGKVMDKWSGKNKLNIKKVSTPI